MLDVRQSDSSSRSSKVEGSWRPVHAVLRRSATGHWPVRLLMGEKDIIEQHALPTALAEPTPLQVFEDPIE